MTFLAASVLAETVDNRLTKPQCGHFLGEMRTLLTGTQSLLAALAKNDLIAAVQIARSLGMTM
jgi:hypothetical protein